MGALYVNSVRQHRVRTGTFPGACDAVFPGDGGAERMRWATSQAWTPAYRLAGRLFVYDIAPRPYAYTGLVLHPVHLDNCNNYSLRFWERDLTEVVFGVEADDGWERIATASMPIPATRSWHSY